MLTPGALTPAQQRSDAEQLRELAIKLDPDAEEADGLMSEVERTLEGGGSGGEMRIWSGPAPDELEQKIRTWIVDASNAAGQLAEYANLCRLRADRLDDDAAIQEEAAPNQEPTRSSPPASGGN